ncbi:hypothetical protein ABZW30_18705 [Kitasatospora sp. NPDC004669]|uniref:hypothetical protein n=1 Tax=Kitasatospora sp. NPDC004669 TaxID=3154555 RepID=UPI0033BC4612
MSDNGSAPIFHQTVQAGGSGTQGMYVTQNITHNAGFTAAELASLMGRLREVAPGLGMGEARTREFVLDVDVLEASDREPEARRSAGRRVLAALQWAGEKAGAAALTAGVQALVGAI